MKPGGIVLLRDYGDGDLTQLRFKNGNKIDDGFYARSDGTFTVFFTVNDLKEAFERAGFETLECGMVKKLVSNRKKELQMDRVKYS